MGGLPPKVEVFPISNKKSGYIAGLSALIDFILISSKYIPCPAMDGRNPLLGSICIDDPHNLLFFDGVKLHIF